MKTPGAFTLLLILCLPLRAQNFSSPRATATGGYLAAATGVYGIEWNMAATALDVVKIETAFGINNDQGYGDYRLLLRPCARHVAAIFHSGTRIDHLAFQIPLPANRADRTPLHFGHDLFHEYGWGLGYAYQQNLQNAFGLDVRQHFYSNTFTSNKFWSLNLSFAHHPSFARRPKEWLSFGAAFRNVVSYNYDKPKNSLTYIQDGQIKTTGLSLTTHRSIYTKPDRRLEAGIALKPTQKLLLTLDLYLYYSSIGYAAGFEWRPAAWLALRMATSDKSDQLVREERVYGLALGVGITYKFVAVDFAGYFPRRVGGVVFDETSTGAFQIEPNKENKLLLAVALAF